MRRTGTSGAVSGGAGSPLAPPSSSRPFTAARSEGSMVSLSSFSFLFAELCAQAYTFPTKVKNVEEVEVRLTALGAHVGMRMAMLSSLRDAGAPQTRPTTVEAALRLLQDKLWSRWFGKAANDVQQESNSDRFFLIDSEPLVLSYVHPSPDYVDAAGHWTVNYAAFMGGMVRGALQSMGFDAEVVTYHQPEEGKPTQTVFVIDFAKQVWERERKVKL